MQLLTHIVDINTGFLNMLYKHSKGTSVLDTSLHPTLKMIRNFYHILS